MDQKKKNDNPKSNEIDIHQIPTPDDAKPMESLDSIQLPPTEPLPPGLPPGPPPSQ